MNKKVTIPSSCVHAKACDSCALRATCSAATAGGCDSRSCLASNDRPQLSLKPISKRNWLEALLSEEMIVVARVTGTRLAGPLHELDEALGGTLTTAISTNNFHGRLGERLAVEVEKPGSNISLKRVLFAGLGDHDRTQRFNLCGLFGLALEAAAEYGAKTVALPFFPYSMETGPISLKGASFILGCRVHNAPSSRGTSVETLKILASPQALRYIEQGTGSFRQLCFHCTDPKLPVSQ